MHRSHVQSSSIDVGTTNSGASVCSAEVARKKKSTFHGVRLDKLRMYIELSGEHSHFQFLVLGSEIGGHLSEECHTLIKQLVSCRASVHPVHLRPFIKNMYKRRWYGVLSCAIQRAVAWNIAGSGEFQVEALHPAPDFEELCATCVDAPGVSRMPG